MKKQTYTTGLFKLLPRSCILLQRLCFFWILREEAGVVFWLKRKKILVELKWLRLRILCNHFMIPNRRLYSLWV